MQKEKCSQKAIIHLDNTIKLSYYANKLGFFALIAIQKKTPHADEASK